MSSRSPFRTRYCPAAQYTVNKVGPPAKASPPGAQYRPAKWGTQGPLKTPILSWFWKWMMKKIMGKVEWHDEQYCVILTRPARQGDHRCLTQQMCFILKRGHIRRVWYSAFCQPGFENPLDSKAWAEIIVLENLPCGSSFKLWKKKWEI